MSRIIMAIFSIFSFFIPESPGQVKDLSRALPGDQEIAGWWLMGEILRFEENDLPVLLNGNGSLFIEFGVKCLIKASYRDKSDNGLNVEIYEMITPEAAYGIYSIFRSEERLIETGVLGVVTDSIVRFQSGSYFVTISLEKGNPLSGRVLMRFAIHVAASLKGQQAKPDIVSMLPDEGFISTRVIYFLGNIGLSRVYFFSNEDIFGFEEGVCGDYGTYRLIILKFQSVLNTQKINSVYNKIQKNNKLSRIKLIDNSIIFVDQTGNHIVMEPFHEYLLVFIGRDPTLQPELFEKIRGEDFWTD